MYAAAAARCCARSIAPGSARCSRIGCWAAAAGGRTSPALAPPRSVCSATRRDTPSAMESGAVGTSFSGLLIAEVYDVRVCRVAPMCRDDAPPVTAERYRLGQVCPLTPGASPRTPCRQGPSDRSRSLRHSLARVETGPVGIRIELLRFLERLERFVPVAGQIGQKSLMNPMRRRSSGPIARVCRRASWLPRAGLAEPLGHACHSNSRPVAAEAGVRARAADRDYRRR